MVSEEIERLRALWGGMRPEGRGELLLSLLGKERFDAIDLFDQVQLGAVIDVCRRSRSLSEAGRVLFAASRKERTSVNDADRLKKYLARFGLEGSAIVASEK